MTTGTKQDATRILSIDVLRGLTIAAMILVNDPGDWQETYPQLRHAEWNGYTAADLIFPNFLFIAGASLVFSSQGKIERATRAGSGKLEIARALLRRTVNLLLLNLLLAALPTFRLRRMRIFGVLFRTAVCALAAGLILLKTQSMRTLLIVIAVLLSAYWALLRIPFGTLNTPLLDEVNNLAAALDRRIAHLFHGQLLTGALYNVTHDPEGLLSSLPAVATVLVGCCGAMLMRSPERTPERKAAVLALSGAASIAVGHVWDRAFPINKNLWTSSYVLVSSGWSLLALSGLYWLLDIQQLEKRLVGVSALTRPARIFGANAVVAYAVSVAGHKFSQYAHVTQNEHRVSVRTAAYRAVFARGASTPLRSLAFAASFAALTFLPNLFLWRKKIYVRL